MPEQDVIKRLIRDYRLNESDVKQILEMTTTEIIHKLIGLTGGFIYRAYLLERLMELVGGPRGIAVPEAIFREAAGSAGKQNPEEA